MSDNVAEMIVGGLLILIVAFAYFFLSPKCEKNGGVLVESILWYTCVEPVKQNN